MSGSQRHDAPEPSQTQKSQEARQQDEKQFDELMKIRRAAGAIAEVIEPVERVRKERTN